MGLGNGNSRPLSSRSERGSIKGGRGLVVGCFLVCLVIGCNSEKGDPRLIGGWRSNQQESVAAALQSDPKWATAPPEEIDQYKKTFGILALTYTRDTMTVRINNKLKTFKYRVAERGDDFVVIQTEGALEDGRDIRIRFVDNARGYWVDTGLGYSEKFDKEGTGRAMEK